MIPGLNSNVKHAGKVFHIQTEDSGVKYAHVISHLYSEGTILASIKHEYHDSLDQDPEALEAQVRKLMRKSHREMVRKRGAGPEGHRRQGRDKG